VAVSWPAGDCPDSPAPTDGSNVSGWTATNRFPLRGSGIPAVNVYLAAEVATYHRLPFALQRTYAPAVMSPKEALDVAWVVLGGSSDDFRALVGCSEA
jgi:hypothetical protein